MMSRPTSLPPPIIHGVEIPRTIEEAYTIFNGEIQQRNVQN